MKRETIEHALMAFAATLIISLLYTFTMHAWKQKNKSSAQAKFSVSSNVLQQQFSADEQIANITYLNSVLAVDGVIRAVEKDGNGHYTIMLGDTSSNVLVICAVDKIYNEEAAGLHTGAAATLKGICKGLRADKLAGLNVMLSSCSIHK